MPVTDDDYISENLTAECEAFVRDNRDRPFFAFLSHYLVHFPLEPKPDKLEKWKSVPTTDQNSPAYAAMVESVDESVGRLMEVLDELELVDNTLVVFTSDNGGFSPRATSNYPLLGGKAFPFEAGMKVPFLVRWPVAVSPGRVSDLRTIAMDIYPTFLEVAGVPLRPEQHADGMSLVPILREEGRTPDRPLVFHYPHYTGYSSPYSAIIENDWKLIHFYNDEAGAYLLFDLSQDPWELHDLVATEPARVESLNAKLESILDEMGAERPVKNPDYDPKWPERQNRDTSYQKALKHRRKIEERIKL
jgi:arylsulfatase A-like enzyme